MLHLGVPDPFGALPEGERERAALTVGAIDRTTLDQKGQRPFVEAARHLPDVKFVFVGKWLDEAADELRASAPDNVEFTGFLDDDGLHDWYRRAAAYVQVSRHEGFGMAVAEAMLAGCVPVVMDVTAMPEVVDGAGVLVSTQDPAEVADGIRRALDADGAARCPGARADPHRFRSRTGARDCTASSTMPSAGSLSRQPPCPILRPQSPPRSSAARCAAGCHSASASRAKTPARPHRRARVRAPPAGPSRARAASGQGGRGERCGQRGAHSLARRPTPAPPSRCSCRVWRACADYWHAPLHRGPLLPQLRRPRSLRVGPGAGRRAEDRLERQRHGHWHRRDQHTSTGPTREFPQGREHSNAHT